MRRIRSYCAGARQSSRRHSAAALGDPVARFHLDKRGPPGAHHLGADQSEKRLQESLGMVNYLYDLAAVESNHERFMCGEVVWAAKYCPPPAAGLALQPRRGASGAGSAGL